MKRIIFLLTIIVFIVACRKKTTTTNTTTASTPVHYDTFTVHYWRIDSVKNSIVDNRTQNFIFESNGATDTIFSEVRKFKSIGTTAVTYFIASKYTNGTYDLTPFFIYAKGTKTSSSNLLESFVGKSYYTNGKTNQIENLTLQKVN
ncbi:MAG: hypothetical protein RL065_668 [Bacteroidota bacterium]|jgi:PBP1b-binding outer membrane lipoprotein LpoB